MASETRDPFPVVLAVVLQRRPWLLFGLAATVAIDRVDISVVLFAMFVLGTAETFTDTTSSTLFPMVVNKSELGIGNAGSSPAPSRSTSCWFGFGSSALLVVLIWRQLTLIAHDDLR